MSILAPGHGDIGKNLKLGHKMEPEVDAERKKEFIWK